MLIARHQSLRKRTVATALTTALSVFATQLAGIQHEATVRHILCVEHGELTDAAPLTAAELAATPHHHARTVVERGEQVPAGSEDIHCLLATWSHHRSTPVNDGPVVAQPQPVLEQALTDVTDRRPPAIALYRLAPKLSPPLA